MTRLLIAFVLLLVSLPADASRKRGGGGHYRSGHGSSHRGGSYKNRKTGDHYRTR